jgi:glycerol-3-phosphate acyltransferase PlsY
MRIVAASLLAYLIGAVPSAYLMGRWLLGEDIRTLGDGNPGAHNALKVMGLLPGLAVALVDVGKGTLALALGRRLGLGGGALWLCGACAVLGHDLPPWLGFRGGQGMATVIGVLLDLAPRAMLLGLLVFVLAELMLHRWPWGWDLSWGVGFITVIESLWRSSEALSLYAIALLLSVAGRRWWQGRVRRLA